MRKLSVVHLSLAALVLALLLWLAVGGFVWLISSKEIERSAAAAVRMEASVRHEQILKLHALVRETKEERGALEAFAGADTDRILDEIDVIGDAAKVTIEIGQSLASPRTDGPLRSGSFVLTASGTFQEVIHAAALFESFPLPSVIDQLQLERSDAKEPWLLVIRMRILTTHDLSSS
jgi:hypothetical protein